MGITGIHVGNPTTDQTRGNGNPLIAAGMFVRADGTTSLAGTVGQVSQPGGGAFIGSSIGARGTGDGDAALAPKPIIHVNDDHRQLDLLQRSDDACEFAL